MQSTTGALKTLILILNKIFLFFSILIFQPAYSDEKFDVLFKKISSTELSEISRLLYLLDEQKKKPKSFYLSTEITLYSELAAMISQNTPHNRCLFPARYNWLKKVTQSIEKFNIDHCFNEKSANPFKSNQLEVSLIFASSTNQTPMSFFGHVFINYEFGIGDPYFSHTFSFTADTQNSQSSIETIRKGMLGGFQGQYREDVFHPIIEKYTKVESRQLISVNLNLARDEATSLYLHLIELKNIKYPYRFFSTNCSTEIYEALYASYILESRKPSFQIYPIDTLKSALQTTTPERIKATIYSSDEKTKNSKKIVKKIENRLNFYPRKIGIEYITKQNRSARKIFLRPGYNSVDSPDNSSLSDGNSLIFFETSVIKTEGSFKVQEIKPLEIESLKSKNIANKMYTSWSMGSTFKRNVDGEGPLSDQSWASFGVSFARPNLILSVQPNIKASIKKSNTKFSIESKLHLTYGPMLLSITHNPKDSLETKTKKPLIVDLKYKIGKSWQLIIQKNIRADIFHAGVAVFF
jgi:hypothetical protein